MYDQYKVWLKIVTNTVIMRWVFHSKPESRDRGTQIQDNTKTSNNQRLANAGEDFVFAYLVNKRFGGYREKSGDFVCP